MSATGTSSDRQHLLHHDEPEGSVLGALFAVSPAIPARTTAWATLGLFAGVVGVASSPWSLMLGACVVLACVGVLSSTIGLAKASRPGRAGGGSAATGLVLAMAIATLVGLRYVGVDTAVADGLSLRPALESLSSLLPPR